jgi:hypothetical protein
VVAHLQDIFWTSIRHVSTYLDIILGCPCQLDAAARNAMTYDMSGYELGMPWGFETWRCT